MWKRQFRSRKSLYPTSVMPATLKIRLYILPNHYCLFATHETKQQIECRHVQGKTLGQNITRKYCTRYDKARPGDQLNTLWYFAFAFGVFRLQKRCEMRTHERNKWQSKRTVLDIFRVDRNVACRLRTATHRFKENNNLDISMPLFTANNIVHVENEAV